MTKSAKEVREKMAEALAVKAATWIVDQLAGTRDTRGRGVSDLENEIYGWLINHAIFRTDRELTK